MLAARLCALAAGLAACACAPTGPPRIVDRVRAAGVLFAVSYAPEDAQAARQVERTLERAVHAAQRWGELSGPVLIAIHPTHRDLEAAARREVAWLRAWARRASVDLQSPRSWSSGVASDARMTELLSHELAHCVMFQAVKSDGRPGRPVPLWFREGMASAAAGQAYGWVSAEALRRLYLDGAPQDDPDADLIYAAAARAFRFLLARFGDEPVRRIMASMSAGEVFNEAFRQATGTSVQQFEGELKERALGSSQARAPSRPGREPPGHGPLGSPPAAPSSSVAAKGFDQVNEKGLLASGRDQVSTNFRSSSGLEKATCIGRSSTGCQKTSRISPLSAGRAHVKRRSTRSSGDHHVKSRSALSPARPPSADLPLEEASSRDPTGPLAIASATASTLTHDIGDSFCSRRERPRRAIDLDH